MLSALIRFFSYAFHGALALFLAALAGLAIGSRQSLHLEMLPWKGSTLNYVLLFGSLFGLLTVALAMRRRLPVLFLIWTLGVAVLMVKGYVFSGYAFEKGEFLKAAALMSGSLISIAGPWSQLRSERRESVYRARAY